MGLEVLSEKYPTYQPVHPTKVQQEQRAVQVWPVSANHPV
jgi:hypothetical protein